MTSNSSQCAPCSFAFLKAARVFSGAEALAPRWASRGGLKLSRGSVILLHQALIFILQLIRRFRVFGIENNAVHGTNGDALRLGKMADAFGAMVGLDFKNGFTLINGLVRTNGSADIAVNTFIGDFEGHEELYLLVQSLG